MPSPASFRNVAQSTPDPTVQANRKIAAILGRWLQVSTRLSKVLSGVDLSSFVDELSEEEEADLRELWPHIQALDAVLDAPADILDLPAKS